MSEPFNYEEAEKFAEWFYGGEGHGWYGISWKPLEGGMRHEAYRSLRLVLEKAAVESDASSAIYHRLTTMARKPSHGRGLAQDSSKFFAFFADLDYGTDGHSRSEVDHAGNPQLPLPPTADEALKCIAAAAIPEPTALIHSGGGLYAYWLMRQPVELTDENRTGVEHDIKALQQQLAAGAATLGYHYDTGVSDLARVLRLPGSMNRKTDQDRPARVLHTEGPRYTLSGFRDVLELAGDLVPRKETAHLGRASELSEEEQEELEFKRKVDPGPFDVLEQQVGFDGVLKAAGWTECVCAEETGGIGCERDVDESWTRPGGGGSTQHSAHTMHENPHVLVVHTGATDFPSGGGNRLTVGRVFAHLHHDGDLTAAARDITDAIAGGGSDAARALTEYGLVVREFESVAALETAEEAAEDGRRESRMPVVPRMRFTPADTHLTKARAMVGELVEQSDLDGEFPRLLRWQEEWWRWTGSWWANYEGAALRKWVYDTGANNSSDVNGILDAMAATLHVPRERKQPSWIGKDKPTGLFTGCRNGILCLDDRSLRAADPAFFNGFAVACDWEPEAAVPESWLSFLKQVLVDDDQITLLQEWFGYVLSGRVNLQKALLLLGPPRSGKGTIVEVLTALVGRISVAKPTFGSLEGPFGLQPLLGKRLAVVGDARLGDRQNHGSLEVLLNVIGGDNPDVARKNKTSAQGEMQVLFMMLSNNIPSFDDPSGAIMTRFEILQTRESFVGREDVGLGDRLMAELPGILRWALEGYDHIATEGAKLTQPESTEAVKEEMAAMVSPMSDWVEQYCVYGAERTTVEELHESYRDWVAFGGGGVVKSRTAFARALRAVCGARIEPCKIGSEAKRGYEGIGLKK